MILVMLRIPLRTLLTSEDRYDENYFEKKPESAFIDASEDCPANNAPTDKLFLKFFITFPMILLKSTL